MLLSNLSSCNCWFAVCIFSWQSKIHKNTWRQRCSFWKLTRAQDKLEELKGKITASSVLVFRVTDWGNNLGFLPQLSKEKQKEGSSFEVSKNKAKCIFNSEWHNQTKYSVYIWHNLNKKIYHLYIEWYIKQLKTKRLIMIFLQFILKQLESCCKAFLTSVWQVKMHLCFISVLSGLYHFSQKGVKQCVHLQKKKPSNPITLLLVSSWWCHFQVQ